MRSNFALARALPLLGTYRGLHPVARGCALMVLGTFMFAGMHTAIRYSTQHLPPVEVAFFRNLFGLVVIAPLLVRYGLSLFHTKRLGLHVLRAVLNVVSMLAFFVGLSMTPLARATALTFTAPLFTALFSALFLGEVFRWRRWTAIFAGFFGALVILRPGLQVFDIGALLVLVSSLLWSMALIDIKVLGRTEFDPDHHGLRHRAADPDDARSRRAGLGDAGARHVGLAHLHRRDRHARPARGHGSREARRHDRADAVRLPQAGVGGVPRHHLLRRGA